MEKKKSLRKAILKVHEIIGLVTGLVVFIVSLTGCLWAFKDEIQGLNAEYKLVEPQTQSFITASQAKSLAQKALPGKEIHGTLFGKPNEALEVIFYEAEPVFYQSVFLNPYTGKLLHIEDHRSSFFSFVLDGHRFLWLPHDIGGNIVAISVLLFLIIILSGLFLWWPNSKKSRKHSFRVNWNNRTKWKKKNYDLHKVAGFYLSAFAFILAFTGCVMGFNWFYYIVYLSAGGSKAPQFIIPNNKEIVTKQTTSQLDNTIPFLREKYPNAESFELHYPHSDSSSVYVEITNTTGLHYNADFVFLDQYTLEELDPGSIYGKYEKADFADKLIRMNYDIHIGSIGGIVGKIIAFLVSLLMTFLPISGFMIWWNKKKGKWKKNWVS